MSPSDLKDFFVSYNRADKTWAEWIAWTLEEAGYSVLIQAWDFRPGGNFVLDMQRAAATTQKTIAVLSEAYLTSAYTQPEWAAAFANDPQSLERKLIPIRVADCQPDGMLRPLVYVDLIGLSEDDAKQALLGMMRDRAKPTQKPTFPGDSTAIKHTVPAPTTFPGNEPDKGNPAIAPTPPPLTPPSLPHFSTYRSETWTGREETIAELTDVLIAGCHLLIIHGMTGIGKTALAEKLAADLLGNENCGRGDRPSLPSDIKFHRISFDIGVPSTDFTRGAIAILQAIGDDTAQQLPDEQILPYLLKTLEQQPYWLQLDSLEYLLHQSDDGSYGFADVVWVEFFVQLLNSPRSQSRLILTSQALPADLVDRIYRYDQL
ncbi:MAG: toll/interleukin-1 receptor domain-containing protein [Leptolyngbyaceae cyanobacterium RM1_406_9]|nr:toll/interleukin-1 receptor domain-containing protein [Leptolyngbyaceae cyanobacterium RM1_406_9]